MKPGLLDRITDMLELPKEIVLDLPKLTLIGRGDLLIENYKALTDFDGCLLKIKTGAGILKISGSYLIIKEMCEEFISISGRITAIEIPD
jgi:sporulation protein YqfC